MKSSPFPQQGEWLLRERGITVRTNDLIECTVAYETRVATVVRVVEGVWPTPGQHVEVRLAGKLPKREGTGARSIPASNVLRVLDAMPPVPQWQIQLLYPKHHFQVFQKGKIHIVRDEITPLWGGPPVDRGKHTLCGLSTAQGHHLDARELGRERVCGSCLRHLRQFRLHEDDWRKRGKYVREYRLEDKNSEISEPSELSEEQNRRG